MRRAGFFIVCAPSFRLARPLQMAEFLLKTSSAWDTLGVLSPMRTFPFLFVREKITNASKYH